MRHLDLDLLQAVFDGDLPPKTLLRRLLGHLGELCPECAEVVAALRQGSEVAAAETGFAAADAHRRNGLQPEVVLFPHPRLTGVLDRAQSDAAEWTKRVRREQRRARVDLQELLRTPHEQRRRRVENARSRFRSRALAELLVEESKRRVRQDPVEAQSLAALVEVVLLWTPGAIDQNWSRGLSLRAHGWEANAWRVQGDLRCADRLFTELRARLACEVSAEEDLHAEICSLEASLRIDQGRVDEARRLVARAADLLQAANEGQALGRVLMQWAIVERRDDDLEAAVRIQRRSLELLDPEEDSELYLQAVANLAFYLVGLERIEEASRLMDDYQPGMESHGVWSLPRLHILRGRIALAKDDPATAESLFAAAQAGFLLRGEAVRAAVVALDLALLYLAQGRTAELRQMARLMGQVFESQDLHEEAMATVVLFQQAVAAETVTAEALRAWRRQLEGGPRPGRARADQPPS